jgi:hypothetical protein
MFFSRRKKPETEAEQIEALAKALEAMPARESEARQKMLEALEQRDRAIALGDMTLLRRARKLEKMLTEEFEHIERIRELAKQL